MDHTNNNCFLLVVLSHGDQDYLWAYDGIYDPDEVLWNQFTAEKCPTLAGKPKFFFLQTCQGGKTDPGIKLSKPSTIEFDGGHSYKIPIYADILIMYATYKDHRAFRNEITGSYFVTVLSEELEKCAFHEELNTILTTINRRVAMEFESNNNEDPDLHGKKQIPYFKSSLTRLVQFVDVTKRTAPPPTFHSTGSYRLQS